MRSFRIGSAFDIPVKLDLTFLLVLPLFAYLIGSEVDVWVGMFNRYLSADLVSSTLTGSVTSFVVGLVAAIGLFVSVLLHELGHSLVARRYGYPISSITLWLFGGIAQLNELPEEWNQELSIAVAGPIVSIGLGLGLFGVFWTVPSILPLSGVGPAALTFILGYLAVTNIALAAFNLLPGFPMDGGRILRALLAINRPYAQATQIAAEVGKFFAILLGLIGLFVGFNIFLIGIAIFIYLGATSEAKQTMTKAAFEGVSVRDIMTPAENVSTVAAESNVSELLEHMFRERHTGYPVLREDRLVGLVTLDDAKNVNELEQDAYLVREIMSTDLTTVDASEDALEAYTIMQEQNIGRLLVMDDEEFAGLVTRSDVGTALTIIRSSGSLEPRTGSQSEHSTGYPREAR